MHPLLVVILLISMIGGLIVVARKIMALCPAQQWPADTASGSGAGHSKKVALYTGSAISAGLFILSMLWVIEGEVGERIIDYLFIILCPLVGFSVATFGLSQQGRIRAAVLGLGGFITVVLGILAVVFAAWLIRCRYMYNFYIVVVLAFWLFVLLRYWLCSEP